MTEVSLASLLQKYQNLQPPDGIIKEAVCEALGEMGIESSKDRVTYINGTIRIDAHPLVRGVVFRRKEELMERVETKLSRRLNDIR